MGLGSPFKGPHKPIHGRLAAAVRAADALFMGNPIPKINLHSGYGILSDI